MTTTQQINLFRPTLSTRGASAARSKLVVVISAVACAALVVLGQTMFEAWQAREQLQAVGQELTAAQAELQTRTTQKLQIEDGIDLAELEKIVRQEQTAIAGLEQHLGSAQVSYAGMLAALARNVAPGVRLTLIEFSDGMHRARIEGMALDPLRVTDYLSRLRNARALDGVELDGLKIGQAGDKSDAPIEFRFSSEAEAAAP